MAIDTAAKRRSAACFKPIHKTPIPDGTIDASDRAHISWLYSGIAIGLPGVVLRTIQNFTNLRAIASATKRSLQTFTNLRTIVAATKRVRQSFDNLRRIE